MIRADAFALMARDAQAHPLKAAWPFSRQKPVRTVKPPRKRWKRTPDTVPRPPRVDPFPGVDIDAVHARYHAKAKT